MSDRLTADELRDAWMALSPEERLEGFRALAPGEDDDFFLELPTFEQAELIRLLPAGERRLWLRLLAPDDAADVLQVYEPDERVELARMLDERTRREVSALLAYAEDAAGGLMNPRFARLRPDMSADQAIRYLRRQAAEQLETVYYAYVLDGEQRLAGVVSFRDLLTSKGDVSVSDIMEREIVTVTSDMDQEAVARAMRQHLLSAVPVVDGERRMQGIVTLDDIVDVVEEEATEDIHKLGGMEALDSPYLAAGFWEMVRKRAGWLAVLFIGEMMTASAMGEYESAIDRAVVLAVFVPLIISSGGNSGSQAATLVIRALSLNEVRLGDWWRIVRREMLAGLALGSILALLGLARVVGWNAAFGTYGEHALLLGITVAISLVGVVLWGTVSGSMLPFIIRRLGADPASASAPFVATLVDVSGLVIYFNVAHLVLAGTLL